MLTRLTILFLITCVVFVLSCSRTDVEHKQPARLVKFPDIASDTISIVVREGAWAGVPAVVDEYESDLMHVFWRLGYSVQYADTVSDYQLVMDIRKQSIKNDYGDQLSSLGIDGLGESHVLASGDTTEVHFSLRYCDSAIFDSSFLVVNPVPEAVHVRKRFPGDKIVNGWSPALSTEGMIALMDLIPKCDSAMQLPAERGQFYNVDKLDGAMFGILNGLVELWGPRAAVEAMYSDGSFLEVAEAILYGLGVHSIPALEVGGRDRNDSVRRRSQEVLKGLKDVPPKTSFWICVLSKTTSPEIREFAVSKLVALTGMSSAQDPGIWRRWAAEHYPDSVDLSRF